MKALGIEVQLNQDQINDMVAYINHNYPEVFGQIWQAGYDSNTCSCAIEWEEQQQKCWQCPDCGGAGQHHCFNCDPYPN